MNTSSLELTSPRTAGRQILSAAATVAAMTVVAKVVALGKERLVASTLGTGDVLDAFLIAWVCPAFAITVVASSLGTALLPAYVRTRHGHGAQAAQRLLSGAAGWGLILLLGATVLVQGGACLALPWLASGFSESKLALTRELLLLLSPVIAVRGLSSIYAAVLNATDRFAFAALTPALTPATIALLLILGPDRVSPRDALLGGTVAGLAMECWVLAAVLRRRGLSPRPQWRSRPPELRRVAGQFLPMASAAFILSSTSVVDHAMAAALGAGNVAALAYATKVVAVPLGLAATALGTAVLPFFSRMLAESRKEEAEKLLVRQLILVAAVTVPLAAALAVGARPVTVFLYGGGAFWADDVAVVSQTMSLAALQIPFYVGGVLIVRFLSSSLANHALLLGNALSLAVNVTLNLLFMPWLGVAGIALSTSCVYGISFLYLWWAWRRVGRRALP